MLRDDLLTIAARAVAAVEPTALLKETCRMAGGKLQIGGRLRIDGRLQIGGKLQIDERPQIGRPQSTAVDYDLSAFRAVFLCAIGKAAESMARYFLETLAIEVDDGIIITKERTEGAEIGSHPNPHRRPPAADGAERCQRRGAAGACRQGRRRTRWS